jgi:hypothetical protein
MRQAGKALINGCRFVAVCLAYFLIVFASCFSYGAAVGGGAKACTGYDATGRESHFYDGYENRRSIAYEKLSDVSFIYDEATMPSADETLIASKVSCSLFNKFAKFLAAETTAGKTIGLGLDLEGDLANTRAAGAMTYEGGAWQKAGLTTVDWGRASVDNSWFRMSFREAAENADAIRFDVSNFSPACPKPGMTTFEFNHILDNGLLPKTTFIQNGQTVIWNGSQFVRP